MKVNGLKINLKIGVSIQCFCQRPKVRLCTLHCEVECFDCECFNRWKPQFDKRCIFPIFPVNVPRSYLNTPKKIMYNCSAKKCANSSVYYFPSLKNCPLYHCICTLKRCYRREKGNCYEAVRSLFHFVAEMMVRKWDCCILRKYIQLIYNSPPPPPPSSQIFFYSRIHPL